MRLYDNAFPSHFEEIETWYPVWYREVYEMVALWRVWGKHLDDIQAGIIRAVDNCAIDHADAQTIGRWEIFIGIPRDPTRTLEERRNVIKAHIIGRGKIGQQEIKEIIAMFTDGVVEVAFSAGVIYITITRDSTDNFHLDDMRNLLESRIPAHLALHISDNAAISSASHLRVAGAISLTAVYQISAATG